MSKGPETRFIASVHRLLPLDLYRMKNHNEYVGGVADVWYSGNHDDIWVEYKYVAKLPKIIDLMDTKKKYSLSKLQQEWLHDRYKEGRRVFVVLGCAEGGVIFARLSWEKSIEKSKLQTVSRAEIAAWIHFLTRNTYELPVRARKGRKRVERCI
jgi:hypothetical protein